MTDAIMSHMKLFYIITICLSLATAWLYAQTPAQKSDKHHITKLPGLLINHDEGYIDVTAKVVLRDGDWLEQLLCTSGTREHESILTTPARPSHIHLGLIMLGLEPGTPMTGKKVGEEMQITPASGPKVAITLRYVSDDQPKDIPANDWVYDKTTDKSLDDNVWLFAGSSFIKTQDQNIYRADASGSVITLVHFGDDMLARQTMLTSRNDNARWQARTKLIPPVGTAVTVRLTPIKGEQKTKNPGDTRHQGT